MKIALAIENADRRRGGAEAYTLDLAWALALRGHHVTVVAQRGPAAVAQSARSSGFQCIYLGARGATRWGRLQHFMGRMREVYQSRSYQILHAMLPLYRCDVYQPHSGLAVETLATGHLKHVHWLRQRGSWLTNQIHLKRRGLAKVEMEMFAHQPHLLCFSSMMRDFAQNHWALPPDRLTMLMNGIDLARFDPAAIPPQSRGALREEWHIGADQPVAMLVGNNWRLKGLSEAITALAACRENNPMLMVVGKGNPAPFRKQAATLGVAQRVIFLGNGQGVADPRPLYAAADLLLLPTRRDTCSLVVLEALAMGLPVITTRQNGASEAITHGVEGFVLERGDATSLVRALNDLCDPVRRAEMSRAAAALRPTLSFEHHVSRIEAVYQAIRAHEPEFKR